MRALDLSFVVALALSTAQCARFEVYDDGKAADPAPPLAAGAPKPASDGPAAIRVPIDGLPAFGNARALVTVVAFTDYECPFCKKAEATLARLSATYGRDLRIVVKVSKDDKGELKVSNYSIDQGGGEMKADSASFQDGEFNITYDGVAWGDTNGPSHHSNSFFPSSTIGAEFG